jgi:lysine-specific demethylase 8
MTTLTHRQQLIKHCTEAASSIHGECVAILSAKGHDDPATTTCLAGCGRALVDLLSRQANIVHILYQKGPGTGEAGEEATSPQKCDLALKRLEDIASIAYSKFYAYLFKDLPACWRQLYTDARILKFCLLLLLKSPYLYQQKSDGSQRSLEDPAAGRHTWLDELVKTLDLALILAGGAGEQRGRRWIDDAFELLHRLWSEVEDIHNGDSMIRSTSSHDRPAKRAKLAENDGASGHFFNNTTFSPYEPFTPPVRHPIQKTEALSLEEFQTYMDRPRDAKLGPEPLIIRNALNEWPALTTRPWNKPSYLLSRTFEGRRLVPVEIGRSYVDEGWGQKLITFGEFLHKYIDASVRDSHKPQDMPVPVPAPAPAPNSSGSEIRSAESQNGHKPIAYLAQHQLFTQLPTLRADILIPDYCYTTPPPHPTDARLDQPELSEPLLHAWLGPPGTISPLHHDPYHNVLAQVVGRKYVRLYAPRDTPRLAARGTENGVEMANTSRLDVGVLEGWDAVARDTDHDDDHDDEEPARTAKSEEDVEDFKTVPFVDCILEPGDALYIPIGWWHYVRGLSVSFSVSFWWN